MKGILLDPYEEDVYEVEVGEDWQEINRLIGSDTFTVAFSLPNRDALFVDDEGLLRDLTNAKFIMTSHYPQPLAGKGLLLGTDEEGDSVDAKSSVEDMRDACVFLNFTELQHVIKQLEKESDI